MHATHGGATPNGWPSCTRRWCCWRWPPLLFWLGHNAIEALARRHVASGFAFLDKTAGFGISQTLIPYTEESSYGQAMWVGLANTLLVSAVSIVLSTLIGFAVGIGRLSSNWLVAKLCTVYVETLRNIPLLLQVVFWYFGVLQTLPGPRDSLRLGQWFVLNNRGVYVPEVIFRHGSWLVAAALVVGLAASYGAAPLGAGRRSCAPATARRCGGRCRC